MLSHQADFTFGAKSLHRPQIHYDFLCSTHCLRKQISCFLFHFRRVKCPDLLLSTIDAPTDDQQVALCYGPHHSIQTSVVRKISDIEGGEELATEISDVRHLKCPCQQLSFAYSQFQVTKFYVWHALKVHAVFTLGHCYYDACLNELSDNFDVSVQKFTLCLWTVVALNWSNLNWKVHDMPSYSWYITVKRLFQLLPFVEHQLHNNLLAELTNLGPQYNAVFELRTLFSLGDGILVAVTNGTAAALKPLQKAFIF